jgi:GT2 family glycosyltransferase
VSVIVPTVGRPQLVGRAVRSALGQTLADLEVRVVVDGPDDETFAALSRIADDRLHVERLPERSGNGRALNVGAAAAQAPWIALLDDDDEWMPEKLARQLHTAVASHHVEPIVSCRFIARADDGDRVWPRRTPAAGQPISEYLFCRRGLFFGDGLLLTSTLFARTALFQRLLFDTALPRHEDLDWVLRASGDPRVGFEFVPHREPLAIWHGEGSRPRISTQPDSGFSRRWIEHRRAEVTPRAYASFLLTWVAANAVREGRRRNLPAIAREAFRFGAPTPSVLLLFLGIGALPCRPRESLGRWATKAPRSRRFPFSRWTDIGHAYGIDRP